MDPRITIDDDDDANHNLQGQSGAGYAWEEEYKRSWDVLKEDDQGSLQTLVNALQQQLKRRKLQRNAQPVQRVIIRHLYIVVDLSEGMEEIDLKPSRMELTFGFLHQFVQEYFDQNPLSQIGIIVTRNGLASEITELSAVPTDHLKALDELKLKKPRGDPSLQNALRLAMSSLMHMSTYASREILIIHSSLNTADPGNILDTLTELVKNMIRVSVIGLSAELHICKQICEKTMGVYNIVLNESHYKDILFEHIPPPPIVHQNASKTAKMLEMGFPTGKRYPGKSILCACHSTPISRGYICPSCSSIVCQLPIGCPICSLTLVSSPLLARLYHHLFPVPNFPELGLAKILSRLNDLNDYIKLKMSCFGCLSAFSTPIPIPINIANEVNVRNRIVINELVDEKIEAIVIPNHENETLVNNVSLPDTDKSNVEPEIQSPIDIDIEVKVKSENTENNDSNKYPLNVRIKKDNEEINQDKLNNDRNMENHNENNNDKSKENNNENNESDSDDDIGIKVKKKKVNLEVSTFDDFFSDDENADNKNTVIVNNTSVDSIENDNEDIIIDTETSSSKKSKKPKIKFKTKSKKNDLMEVDNIDISNDKPDDDEEIKVIDMEKNVVNDILEDDELSDEEEIIKNPNEIVKQALLKSLHIQSGGPLDGVSIAIHIPLDAAEALQATNLHKQDSLKASSGKAANPTVMGLHDEGQMDLLYIGDKPSGRYECPRCKNHFCFECDVFIHDVLHNCPGCKSTGFS